jgi:septal ring factor EnvC (AmiA/AmiB activator)
MKKMWKYVVGFFTLLGGILIAFLSGKSAGRRDEKLKDINKDIKSAKKVIDEKTKSNKNIEKSLKNKKKALEEIKNRKSKTKKDVTTKEAADFLKKYSKKSK